MYNQKPNFYLINFGFINIDLVGEIEFLIGFVPSREDFSQCPIFSEYISNISLDTDIYYYDQMVFNQNLTTINLQEVEDYHINREYDCDNTLDILDELYNAGINLYDVHGNKIIKFNQDRLLNLTTKFNLANLIKNYKSWDNLDLSATYQQNFKYITERQGTLEESWLANYTSCGNISKEDVLEQMSTLDINSLTNNVNKNFYDPKIMQVIACVTESITYDNRPNGLAVNDRIHEYISKLRQIGAESANGIALLGSLKKSFEETNNNMFVIKAPISKDDNKVMRHECFVAFFGTNLLRSFIPNFSYIYAMFDCSSPILDNKDVVTWCNTDTKENVKYAVYENITSGVSLSEIYKTCTTKQFMSYYIQLLFALKIANRQINFTHFDAHGDNILARKHHTNNSFYIKYDNIYLLTDSVLTFIDYGMSHISVTDDKNKTYNFGYQKESMEKYGIKYNKSNIVHDAFKILCNGLFYTRKYNKQVYDEVKILFGYFDSTEAFGTIMPDLFKLYFAYIPEIRGNLNYDIDDHIDYCINYAKNMNIELVFNFIPSNEIVIDCTKNIFDFETTFNNININSDVPFTLPKNLFEFYDTYTLLKNNEFHANILKIDVMDNIDMIVMNTRSRFEDLTSDFYNFQIVKKPANNNQLKNMIPETKSFIYDSAIFLDSYYRLSMIHEISLFTKNLIPAKSIEEFYDEVKVFYEDTRIRFNELIKVIDEWYQFGHNTLPQDVSYVTKTKYNYTINIWYLTAFDNLHANLNKSPLSKDRVINNINKILPKIQPKGVEVEVELPEIQ